MVDAQKLADVLAAMADAGSPEKRRRAERSLEAMVAELIDEKVLRSLCGPQFFGELAKVAMAAGSDLTPAARVVLDRFRYRLAHVAMRNQEWDLAEALLNVVLAGEGDLTRARLFRAVCRARDLGRIPEDDLVELLDCLKAEQEERLQRPPLDVLIQDPTTNMLKVLILSQGASPNLLDRLYDPKQTHGTTGLTLLIHPEGGNAMKVVMSEWLGEAHLQDYRQEGWLVVDTTVSFPGERGRGSKLSVDRGNLKAPILNCVAHILARRAPFEVPAMAVQERFYDWDAGRISGPDGIPSSKWSRVSVAELTDHPGRKVIGRSTGTRGEVNWRLIPPYAVVLSDASTVLRQAAGSSQ
jgi:hypothetical protein